MALAVLVRLSPLLFFFPTVTSPFSLCSRFPFVVLPFISSSFSGFYKPKNGLQCNVQLGNGM
jgi:hypothetical protein